MNDTIVALSTASGIGAIALIRLSGEKAIQFTNEVFSPKDLSIQASHTAHFGYIKDGETLIDEVVVTLFKAPHSFTKEDVVEISCHGSPYIVQQILHLILQTGARLAKPGEFTQRAFLNGRFDLAQAEAVSDLIASESAASHHTAMNQMRGGFSKQLKDLRTELINFASLIELELDFSEEDVEFANRKELQNLINKIIHTINPLMESFELGNVIKNGVLTVIAGRPNAGKSTLLNALLNEERAIVSEIAGTTRDTIEEVLIIKGLRFRIVDTAGIREATDAIEAIGVERTYQKVQQAAVLVYVYDITNTSVLEAREDILKLLMPNMKIVVIANKSDLKPDFKSYVLPQMSNDPELIISSKRSEDIELLKETLWNSAGGNNVSSDQTVLTNLRHFEALQKTKENLLIVLDHLFTQQSSDFLAMDIRQALFHLGEITGEITTDDLLETIFSKFCIGK